MPQDLPGFYYDAEKNRYFPIKGPIPGSTRKSSSSSSATSSKQDSMPKPASNIFRRTKTRTGKLLQDRELHGNAIDSNKGKYNFQEEYYKRQASRPLVWKFMETDRTGDGALEHINVNKQTPAGLIKTSVLLTGCTNTTLSLLEVGKVDQMFDSVECMPDLVWPLNIETQRESCSTPERVWRPIGSSVFMPSIISSMKVSRKHSSHTDDDVSTSGKALITTLGSETSRGSVYLLDLIEPLDFTPSNLNLRRRMHEVASFSCTIWTADCNSKSQAVIGTNLGAILLNLETGASSWVYRSQSDVFSQQFDQSGNLVLCGLRNGAIMTIDIRQKQGGSSRLTRHRVPYPNKTSEPLSGSGRNFTKQWFEFDRSD